MPDESPPPRRTWLRPLVAGGLGALVPLLPFAALCVLILLEGNPDGAAGWTALGVVTVPFGALGGLVAGLLALRGRALVGFALGFGLGAAPFVGLFLEPLHELFTLLGAFGIMLGAAAGALVCRPRRARVDERPSAR